MTENFKDQIENKNEKRGKKEEKKREIIALALELSESRETFIFPGIEPEVYSKIKADEEEFTGRTTPLDELLEKFRKEGMKVVLGKNPDSGNIFILPSQSNDIERDSIFSRHLQISGVVNEKLRKLILMSKS